MNEIQSVNIMSVDKKLHKITYDAALSEIRREITALPKLNIHALISSRNIQDFILNIARKELKTIDNDWIDENKKLILASPVVALIKYYSMALANGGLFNIARFNLWREIIEKPEILTKKYIELRDSEIKKINPNKLDHDIDIAETNYAMKLIDGTDTADYKRQLSMAISVRYTAYQTALNIADDKFIKILLWDSCPKTNSLSQEKIIFDVSSLASLFISSVFIKNGGGSYSYLLTEEKLPIFAVVKTAIQMEPTNQNWRRIYCNWLPIYKYGYMFLRNPDYSRLREEMVYWQECISMAERMLLPDYKDTAIAQYERTVVALSGIIAKMEYDYMNTVDRMLLENEIVTVSICKPTPYMLIRSIGLMFKRIVLKVFGE